MNSADGQDWAAAEMAFPDVGALADGNLRLQALHDRQQLAVVEAKDLYYIASREGAKRRDGGDRHGLAGTLADPQGGRAAGTAADQPAEAVVLEYLVLLTTRALRRVPT